MSKFNHLFRLKFANNFNSALIMFRICRLIASFRLLKNYVFFLQINLESLNFKLFIALIFPISCLLNFISSQ